MSNEYGSVTEMFRRLVERGAFQSVDAAWRAFVAYLGTRTPGVPGGLLGIFQGHYGQGVIDIINRWIDSGIEKLADPGNDETDAIYFREFERKNSVVAEVLNFIDSSGPRHLLQGSRGNQ